MVKLIFSICNAMLLGGIRGNFTHGIIIRSLVTNIFLSCVKIKIVMNQDFKLKLNKCSAKSTFLQSNFFRTVLKKI
jgi:hypothetical protein